MKQPRCVVLQVAIAVSLTTGLLIIWVDIVAPKLRKGMIWRLAGLVIDWANFPQFSLLGSLPFLVLLLFTIHKRLAMNQVSSYCIIVILVHLFDPTKHQAQSRFIILDSKGTCFSFIFEPIIEAAGNLRSSIQFPKNSQQRLFLISNAVQFGFFVVLFVEPQMKEKWNLFLKWIELRGLSNVTLGRGSL